MLILGLNAYHGDAAACLVQDGVLVAAAEEERFRRVKHWAGFPTQAISYCLDEAHVTLSDLDHVAINSDPKANLRKKIAHTLLRRPDPRFVIERLKNQGKRQSVEGELAIAFPATPLKAKIHRIEHHLAHLASCFLVSPFREASLASIDGFGDFSSAAWGTGQNNMINIEERVYFPHSLGIFYQALTQFLGFPYYGDEYKVMGLAPYGEPRFLPQMRRIVRLKGAGGFALDTGFFRHHRENIAYEWEGGSPHVGTLYAPTLEALLGPPRLPDEPLEARHRDLARSVQAMYEEAFFHLIDSLYARHKLESLTVAGGCAMNSVANGKVLRRGTFKRFYVQSAAGDAGGAIGSAFEVWHRLAGESPTRGTTSSVLRGDLVARRFVMDHAYLGPASDDNELAALFAERADEFTAAGCRVDHVSDEDDLCRRAAAAVAEGEVVGWFQGRMEWGPRALGNRSIVCDPRRADMKDILNRKIKRRESFRPFAPSVLKEYAAEWFEEDGDVPFMMQVYQIREPLRGRIPAVTHVDGSGRLQTVYRETNRRYWLLIDEFRRITGVPMVLNTSFNENEPVVCRPAEALDCFLRTNMDALVMGDWMVRREIGAGSRLSPQAQEQPVARASE